MDGQHRFYRRLIGENAMQVLLRLDCSEGKPPTEAQVQAALERCRDTLMKDHDACDLILNSSDAPAAQSYRNIRHSNMSEMLGEVLKESMVEYPEKQMTVLCGHTHSSGQVQILNNLEVLTGKSSYGEPKVQQIVEVA